MPNLSSLRLPVLGLALVCWAAHAASATFTVSPVRIYLQARERAAAVTLSNDGDSELLIEAQLFQWRQTPEGADELTPTQDLLLAPPVLKLAPRSRQVLRLANLKPVPPDRQLTYRMVVREVPSPVPAGVQINLAVAFSLPVFITPPGVQHKLACTARRTGPAAVMASCANNGGAFAQPVNFVLRDAAGTTVLSQETSGGYILPGSRREFELTRAMAALPAGSARLQVTLDDGGTQSFDVVLAN